MVYNEKEKGGTLLAFSFSLATLTRAKTTLLITSYNRNTSK